ncbi:MFS transporter [Pelagicoccus sp. NFK12]|uniref:MFS transporter n=1 Tax=Pelagicoccus enzymogenes TaxID=2773457 RepID=A0A927IJ21_9BACT|nr:MFS transporter [Pelagicoccus enzymogenes]MBD5781861.1 MFS transporter [Pelagicoccus enzymogenes]
MQTTPETKHATPPLKMSEKLGYAAGDLASCLYFGVFMNYLAIFYTDVFGISAGALAFMILVTRTWDWINDPIMGIVADRTKSKFGKFRPWLIWILPFWVVLGVLTFTTFDLGESHKLIYAYVTYTFLMMAYTAINVPYSALMGVMTPRSDQRTLLNSFRFLGAFLGTTTVSFSMLYLVKFFGNGNDQTGYAMTMGLFGVISAGLFLTTFFTTKERIEPPKGQKTDIGKDLAMAAKNGPWRAIIFISILTILWISIRSGTTAHFFKYVSGNELWAGTYLGVGGAIQAGGVLLTKQITQIFGGKKNAYFALTAINVALLVVFYWLPYDNLTILLVHQIISSFLTAPLMALFWSMLADTADYGQWKLGHRATGLLLSTGTSSMKIGWSLGPAIAFWMLEYTFGFVANQAQTPATIEGMRLLMSLIPAGVGVLAAAAVFLYRIDSKTELEMEAAIAKQRDDEEKLASTCP